MIIVSELLSLPVFKDFRLVTSRDGINNRVADCMIFEYETADEIKVEFNPRDFIFTSFSLHYQSKETMVTAMHNLCEQHPAAIAICETFISELPQEAINVANEYKVPVFFFKKQAFSNLIYAIKNALTAVELNTNALKKTREIMNQYRTPSQRSSLAREINPLFSENLICSCWMPRDIEHGDKLIVEYSKQYNAMISTVPIAPESAYSILRFPRGMLIFYSDSRGIGYLERGLEALHDYLNIPSETFSCGFSQPRSNLGMIDISIKEATYAAATALIEKTEVKHFNEIGISSVLCALRNTYWVRDFYFGKIKNIKQYDKINGTELFDTMIAFSNCRGDIKLTAQQTFQHSNTIRYRLEKIYEIIEIENTPMPKLQVILLARLYQIEQVLAIYNE